MHYCSTFAHCAPGGGLAPHAVNGPSSWPLDIKRSSAKGQCTKRALVFEKKNNGERIKSTVLDKRYP